MSGKIIQDAAKNDIKRFQAQKAYETMTSAATPPPLPSRTGSKSIPPYPAPKPPTPSKCGCSEGACVHRYDDITLMSQQTDQEQCQYEQLVTVEELSGNTVTTKLRLIEDNQMRLRHEFNNFRNDVMREIKSLQVSIKSLEEASNSLDESMTESFAYQQSIMDKMESKFLQNIDHLGKLILDVRRDIMEASKVHPSLFRPHDAGMGRHQLQKHTHTFEWEVGNLESLVKHQQKASSQSYLIGHVDFKILGGAVCTRDGRLCVRIYGDFTHMPINLSESKNGNFECSVYLVDKLGKRPNFLVGKVAGDFNNDKEWMIGDVPAADIQSKGYTARDGNVNLKFVIDVYA